MDAPVRLLAAPLSGGFTTFAAEQSESVVGGIVIFAVGIIVGLVCVLAMDFTVRRKMRRDFEAWVEAGRPERRVSERRGRKIRAARRQDDAGGP